MDIDILPDELIADILGRLDITSLLRCAETCRFFYTIIAQSQLLQYHIALAKDGLVHALGSNSSPAHSISELQTYRRRWQSLEHLAVHQLPIYEPCHAYELVNGIFAKAMPLHQEHYHHVLGSPSASRRMTFVYLPTSDLEPKIHNIEDIGFEIRDFAIDPGQDLLVLLEHETMGDGTTTLGTRGIKLHFHTISNNETHPQAKVAVVSQPFGYLLGGAEIQVVEDVVSVHTRRRLFIWNWMSGLLLVNLDIECIAGSDFDFLSARSFLLANSYPASLFLYTFSDAYDLDMKRTYPAPPTQGWRHAATLKFPPAIYANETTDLTTHTSPFYTTPSEKQAALNPHLRELLKRNKKPFTTSPDHRIHVLTLQVEVQPDMRQATFFVSVRNSQLKKFCGELLYTGEYQKTRVFEWEEWGMRHTHWTATNRLHNWLRYVHGERYIHPCAATGASHMHINDYSTSPLISTSSLSTTSRRNVGRTRASDQSRRQEKAVQALFRDLDLVPTIPTHEAIEQEDLHENINYTTMEFKESTSRETFDQYTGFMIDEDRVLGFKTMGDGTLATIDIYCFT